MKTSELISKLQAAVEEHGDLEATYWEAYDDHLEYVHGVELYEGGSEELTLKIG